MNTKEMELIWAAGFFDGEGCTSFCTTKSQDGKITGYKAQICIAQVQREPLGRFRAAVGVGTVNGPYKKQGANQKPQYRYSIQSKAGTRVVIDLLDPYLCSVKRKQAKDVFALVDAQPNMLNSKYKTHCKWGHELTPENVYVPPRRPGRRYCKACMKARNNGTFSDIRLRNS